MQELIRLRRGDGFIGRCAELTAFHDNLSTGPGDPEHRFLFHVHGAAGIGKTSLVRQFEQTARERGALTVYIDDTVHSLLDVMESVSQQLAQQGHALKDFDKLLSRYRRRRHEADSAQGSAPADAPVGAPADASDGGAGQPEGAPADGRPPTAGSRAVAQAGLAGLELLPGIGSLAARAADPEQLAHGMDRWRAALSMRLRREEDVRLVLSPVCVLTPVFLTGLGEAAARVPWIALFFDTYERTGPLVDGWLRDVMVSDRYGAMPANTVVTLSGQPPLDPSCWGDDADFVAGLPLEPFTEAEARQLLAAKSITDERVIDVILRLSERLPVLTSMLAETRPDRPEDIGDPSGTAVERFLKWVTDPVRRAAALAGALPLELDEDVFRTVADADAGLYDWLRRLPFVRDRSGRCQYHDVVRATMLRVQRNQSPLRWRELHARLAEFHAERRAEAERALDPGDAPWGAWTNERWRAHRRDETYHLLCADPAGALPRALRDAVAALDVSVAAARGWAETLVRAGRDAASEPVRDWGVRLREPLLDPDAHTGTGTGSASARLRACRVLLGGGAPLDAHSHAVALALCGSARVESGDHEGGLAELDRAVEIAPESVRMRVHQARGDARHGLDRAEDAIADVTRSPRLLPDDGWTPGRPGIPARTARTSRTSRTSRSRPYSRCRPGPPRRPDGPADSEAVGRLAGCRPARTSAAVAATGPSIRVPVGGRTYRCGLRHRRAGEERSGRFGQ